MLYLLAVRLVIFRYVRNFFVHMSQITIQSDFIFVTCYYLASTNSLPSYPIIYSTWCVCNLMPHVVRLINAENCCLLINVFDNRCGSKIINRKYIISKPFILDGKASPVASKTTAGEPESQTENTGNGHQYCH